jgi:hypothetical protein
MKARISQLHKTAAEWQKHSEWTPEPGEIVVYDPDETTPYSRIKIGDGERTLKELDFFINSAIAEILDTISFSDSIDGGRIGETEYKD